MLRELSSNVNMSKEWEKEKKLWNSGGTGGCLFKLQPLDMESYKTYWKRTASRPLLPCPWTKVFSNYSLHCLPPTLSHQEFQGKCASERSGYPPCWLHRKVKETHSWPARPDGLHTSLRGNQAPLQDTNGRKPNNPQLFMWEFTEDCIKIG